MKYATFLILVLALSGFCFADTTIVQQVISGPMMGQPGTNTTQTMKIKGMKARIDMASMHSYQILDLNSKKMYMVDPDKKQAMVMSVDMLSTAGQMFKQANKGADIKVENLGTTQTINGFKCADYQISISGAMGMTSKQCVTTDVDYKDFEAFRPYAEGMLKSLMGDEAMSKLPKGIAASSETTISMMGQNHTAKTELKKVTKEEIPASLFEIPADYKTMEAPMGKPQEQHP
jgi:uncharacterized protein DUF4412